MVLGMDSESELAARVFELLAKLIETSKLGCTLLMRRPWELAEALDLLVEFSEAALSTCKTCMMSGLFGRSRTGMF